MTRVVTITQYLPWEEIAKCQKLPVVEDINRAIRAKNSVFVNDSIDEAQLESLLHDENKVLLVYPPPSMVMEHSLYNGCSVKEATKICLDFMVSLTRIFKQYRKYLTLLNGSQLSVADNSEISDLNALGWPIDDFAVDLQRSTLANICSLIIKSDENLDNTQQLLSGCSVLMTENECNFDIERTIATYLEDSKAKKKLSGLEDKSMKLAQENTLLIHQVMNLQEELEKYYKNYIENENATTELRIKLSETESIAAETGGVRNGNKKVSRQKFKKLQNELLAKDQKIERLENEIQNIHNSAAWKIGTPIRAFSKITSRLSSNNKKIKENVRLIQASEYFDDEWYLKRYPDVKDSGVSPAEHYLLFGGKEGRMPSPNFDGRWYLRQYSDIAAADLNPLLHFIKFGKEEGREGVPKSPKDINNNGSSKE